MGMSEKLLHSWRRRSIIAILQNIQAFPLSQAPPTERVVRLATGYGKRAL